MRKLAIFLVVFLGGFAALYFVSRYREEQREAVAPIPIERPPQTDEQVPTEVPTDDGTDGVQVVSSGEGSFTEYDDETGRIITVMRHRDSRQLTGNRHELIDVEVESFDPETGERRAVLTASRAEAVVVPETGRLSVDPDTPVRFEDAILLIEEEGRLAPLTISMPWVHVWPKEERFDSDAPVTVEGVGLSASSLGIRVRDLGRRLTLPAKGDVRLVREDDQSIRLRALEGGVIDVRRVEGDDTDLLSVLATEGARFEWFGDEPLNVEARTIDVSAEVRGGEAQQRYRVLEAEARGDVSMDSTIEEDDGTVYTTHFESDRARFDFARGGDMRGAVLSGSPSGEVIGPALDSDPDQPTGFEVSGVGPLRVGFGDVAGLDLGFETEGVVPDVAFTMEGPGQLTLRGVDLKLDASRRLTGAADLTSKSARAKLSGDVVARGADGRFEGAELDLDVVQEGGEAFAIAKTERPATLQTVEGAADPWFIETNGPLELHLRKGRFDVPLAHNVHVENNGPAKLELDAGRLTDFLWLDRTFRADEGVTFDTPHGFGSAQRVEALSATNRMFVGTEDEPANFVFRDNAGRRLGELDARRVWVTPGVVQAEEDVFVAMEARGAKHELDCDRAVLRSPLIVEDTRPDAQGEFHVDAYGVRRAHLRTNDGEAQLVCEHLEVAGRAARHADEGRTTLVIDGYEAEGGVTAKVVDRQEITLSGKRFVWSEADGGRGFVEPEEGKRMTAVGRLPDSELPYDLTADRVEFTRESLHAVRPLIDFEVRMHVPEGEPLEASSVRQVMSEHLVADESGALFSGDVHLTGWADKQAEQPWTLDAGSVHLAFEQLREAEELTATNAREVVAWDGIEIQVGDDQRARADLLYLDYRTLRLEGAPAVFDLRGFTWESSGMEFDVYDVLLTTEQGTIRAAEDTAMAGWTVRYESMQPFPRDDDTILALRGAVCSNGIEQIRADWMLFWVDRDEWRRSAESWLDMPIDTTGVRVDLGLDDEEEAIEPASERPQGETPNVFGALDAGSVSHILREVYLEGDIQVTRKGEHASRFEAIYVDLVDGHGWVEDAELTLKLKSRGHTERLSLKSELLRHSADGSLHADAATVTTCMFAKPEYVIETGDLSLVPDKDPDVSWRVSVKKNKLRFQDTVHFEVPLPPIKNAAVDRSGRPVVQGISFGNSSRYGNFVSLGFSNEIGDTVTEGVARAMGATSEDVDGSYSLRARWLSSRGLLLQGGVELDVGEKFWSELYLAGINDDSDDVGIVRVPTDERSAPRWGLSFRSRYLLTEQEWFDFVVAKSSDAGFQSEFFEPEFTSFEERQTYVHWRKARDAQYYSAIVQVRLDDFRNDVEQLPEAGFYQGLKPVGELFGEPLLWVGDADVGYLRRLEGSGTARSPFDPVFVDPYGERESGRLLTQQRLEVPVHVGGSGIRFTPYTAVAGQAWTEGVDPESSPARAALFAGAELSGEFHRVLPGNYLNTIVPSIGFRGDLADVEEGGDPIPFDRAEEPLTGNVVDLVLRSRFTRPQDKRRFDIGLRTAYAYETTKSQDDGWLPMSVLSEFYTEYKNIPVGFTYDMRFDFEESNTVYSRSALGLEPWEPLGLEFGYNRGLDSAYERLYEAASIAARWDINWKWDLEGRQTISLKGEDNLYSEFTLRRYGHDLFFEVRYAMRQGEGSSISFGLKPVVGHRLDSLGLLDAWKESGLR